jgi:hypothetical protein
MSGFVNRGLGDTTAPNLSFLGGSVFTAAAIGIGLIVLFKVVGVGGGRRSSGRRRSGGIKDGATRPGEFYYKGQWRKEWKPKRA